MNTKAEKSDWEVQALRASFFLHSAFEDPALWHNLVGETPEADDHRPREAKRIQNGSWKGAILETQVSPARIDIVWTPAPTADGSITFGEFNSRAAEFKDLIVPWLAKVSIQCVRLALGSIVVRDAATKDEAYGVLSKYLPSLKVNSATTRELLYRVNHPIASSVVDGHINRLTTWMAMIIKLMTASGAGVQFQNVERHFARLECDLSSSELRGEPIPREQLGPLFEELCTLTRENTEKGELP